MTHCLDLRQSQNRLLDMATTAANILDNHKIPHMIAFGTLLGAVRHGGFIPWDDDFDFLLFADSYQQAIAALRAELPADMLLEDEKSEPKYFHNWAHIKDLTTICKCDKYPQDLTYAHHGLSIDLYIITEMAEKDYASFRYNENMAYINRRKALNLISDEEYENRKKSYLAHIDIDKKWTSDEHILAYPYDNGRHNIEDVYPLKKYTFEDRTFWGPHNAHNILTMVYGDYSSLPPEKDRQPHYSEVLYQPLEAPND